MDQDSCAGKHDKPSEPLELIRRDEERDMRRGDTPAHSCGLYIASPP
jgi:hypothetical protein